jgi:hypothetical protein
MDVPVAESPVPRDDLMTARAKTARSGAISILARKTERCLGRLGRVTVLRARGVRGQKAPVSELEAKLLAGPIPHDRCDGADAAKAARYR